jgi:amino acid permease
MRQETKRFWQAVLTLVGATVGVGIFGVPYAIAQAGAGVAILYFAVLGGIQFLQNLFYAEAAIAEPKRIRLVGLVGKYLGPRARRAAAVSLTLGFWASMTAYMLVGGSFLHALLGGRFGGQPPAYQLGWALAVSTVVYFGLGLVSRVGSVATLALIAAVATIFAAGASHVDLANLSWAPGPDLFLPYGVILFSLGGMPAIPEMEDILKGRHRSYRLAVVLGTSLALVLTAGFGFMVWGATSAAITPSPEVALRAVLGPGVAAMIAAFGSLSVTTAFLASAIHMQDTFEYDYKLRRRTAWLMTVGPPLAVFFLGAKDFVAVISFSGAVFGGVTAVLVSLLYAAIAKGGFVKEKKLGVPVWMAYVCATVLALGAAYETWLSAGKLF